MSERKVLNKYYPPDFDPLKIPKLKLPKDRQYVVQLMAPFNMRCKTCGEYIYKGKQFNARKETVQNEAYLDLPIFRFYIKCTRCLAEITFKTDPENTDYTMEHGATRNFQAEKLLEEEDKLETAPLLEEARHRRLLEDSDSEDEVPPSQPQAAARPNPTAIINEVPKTKRKAEALCSKAQLAGLVVPKKVKTEANGGSEQVQVSAAAGAPEIRKAANATPQTPGASSLSQLGAYEDSEDSGS